MLYKLGFFYELMGRKIEVLGEFLVEVWGAKFSRSRINVLGFDMIDR